MSRPDFSALRIAIDLVEQGGMSDEAAILRRMIDREESPWTRIDDALPIDSATCLVYRLGSFGVSTWMKRRGEWLRDTDTATHRFQPTHWTPIPVPPPDPSISSPG